MSMTHEEMLAAQTELYHFNDKHDKLGRFSRKNGGSTSSAKGSEHHNTKAESAKDSESPKTEDTSSKSKAKETSITDSLSPRGKEIAKKAGKAAGVAAGVSALATAGNAINAQRGLDLMGYGDRLSGSAVVKAGTIKAGKVAAVTALAVIGGHMIADYMRKEEPSTKKTDRK